MSVSNASDTSSDDDDSDLSSDSEEYQSHHKGKHNFTKTVIKTEDDITNRTCHNQSIIDPDCGKTLISINLKLIHNQTKDDAPLRHWHGTLQTNNDNAVILADTLNFIKTSSLGFIQKDTSFVIILYHL